MKHRPRLPEPRSAHLPAPAETDLDATHYAEAVNGALEVFTADGHPILELTCANSERDMFLAREVVLRSAGYQIVGQWHSFNGVDTADLVRIPAD